MRSSIVKELKGISDILDVTPSVMDRVFKDLTAARCSDTGREGMTAKQVLRCAILKQYRELTYEELAFHLEDSEALKELRPARDGPVPFEVHPPERTSRRSPKRRGRPSTGTSWSVPQRRT